MICLSYEFPFTLQDVAHLCGIPIRGDKASEYITCPFCGRKKKMNLNYTKGQYNCPACGEGGHMLKLFAKLNGMSSSSNGEITNEIKRRLNIDYKPATPYKIRDIIIRDDVHEDTSMNIDLDKMLHYHSVYKSFIDKLCLSEIHREKLYNRQIDDKDIEHWQFKSVPLFGYKRFCKELIEEGLELEGIPGFYYDYDSWSININPKTTGIIIPTYNILGYIEGLQIRLDRPFGKTKYLWISSDGKYKGTAVKAIPFFVKGIRKNDSLIITEGAFKAIIPNKIWGYSILGIAGVNNQKEIKRIIPVIKQLGYTKIIEAFDADFRFNDKVARAKEQLKSMMIEYGFTYETFEWDYEKGKGLDDYAIYYLNQVKK